MRQEEKLLILASFWCSFSAVLIGASVLLPTTKSLQDGSPALLYKIALKTADSHQSVALSPDSKTLIADLREKTVAVYDRSTLIKTFNILSVGREGTPWQTPTGHYTVQTKEREHYSSIGGTWMPYSMQFYGNFFIHGWPTDADGKDVPKGYSGGCIRISTEDARELYELTPLGTRLVVIGSASRDSFATSSRYYLRGGGVIPRISAKTFFIADADSGVVLWSRSADKTTHPGNLVSLMSALTAVETVNQYKVVRISELLLGKGILRKYSTDAKDEMPAGTLIYPLLFDANDTAAKVFAREHGTKKFVSFMNEKAAAIGMGGTVFGGALSVDDATTTAKDMMTLLRHINLEKHFLISVTLAKDRASIDDDGYERYRWENKNPWVDGADSSYQGGLADIRDDGSGNATLLFSLPVSEFGKRTVAFVVLDSAGIKRDVIALKQFVSDHFVYGIQESDSRFVREPNDSILSLPKQIMNLVEIEQFISDEMIYDKNV